MGERGRPARLLGVECEYDVALDGQALDMRTVIDSLPVSGWRLDPGDPHAIRTHTGGVITADGPQAETASPPVRTGPTAVAELVAHQRAGAAQLQQALGRHATLTGFSTHVNVQIRDRAALSAALRACGAVAVPLMLLTSHHQSPGLLVRPRWNRLEFGCEYLPPHQLAAALPMAWAVTELAERRRGLAGVLPRLRSDVVPSRQRFGWYIDRRAFGPDLLGDGRAAELLTEDGSSITAGELLHRLWEHVAPRVTATFGQEVAEGVAAVVGGALPLACEEGLVADRHPPTPQPRPLDLSALTYGPFVLRPHTLTWRTAVFEVTGQGRTRWLSLPGDRVQAFAAAVAAASGPEGGRTRGDLARLASAVSARRAG